ncbi:c-type cytochrome [Microbaculum sp. FT89]|uniref:c-type cytochrome n=1 Tax=Microbaculum sp. FT89 TaxID=3447298 RepID=UPI003F5322A0
MKRPTGIVAAIVAVGFVAWGGDGALAKSHGEPGEAMEGQAIAPGLAMPGMDPIRGRDLFASKGCVVCHAINGVGGEDAPALDADTMPAPMNPFEFAAKMWRGAEAMVYLQREELGEPIAFDGAELADIIAFVHDAEAQRQFSASDIPAGVRDLMHHMEDGDDDHGDADEDQEAAEDRDEAHD